MDRRSCVWQWQLAFACASTISQRSWLVSIKCDITFYIFVNRNLWQGNEVQSTSRRLSQQQKRKYKPIRKYWYSERGATLDGQHEKWQERKPSKWKKTNEHASMNDINQIFVSPVMTIFISVQTEIRLFSLLLRITMLTSFEENLRKWRRQMIIVFFWVVFFAASASTSSSPSPSMVVICLLVVRCLTKFIESICEFFIHAESSIQWDILTILTTTETHRSHDSRREADWKDAPS